VCVPPRGALRWRNEANATNAAKPANFRSPIDQGRAQASAEPFPHRPAWG
jgi:hypothetical protein